MEHVVRPDGDRHRAYVCEPPYLQVSILAAIGEMQFHPEVVLLATPLTFETGQHPVQGNVAAKFNQIVWKIPVSDPAEVAGDDKDLSLVACLLQGP